MKKNGGPGTMRQSCVHRKCRVLLSKQGKSDQNGDIPLHAMQNFSSCAPVGREYVSGLWRDGQGQLIKYNTPGRCAGCNGARDEECTELDEPTVLCDGNFCTREYHLKCANLEAIPESEFFCFDCCPMGASKGLNDFFYDCESNKSVCGSSEAFVMAKAKKALKGAGFGTKDVEKCMAEFGKGGKFESEIGSFTLRRERALEDLAGSLGEEDDNEDDGDGGKHADGNEDQDEDHDDASIVASPFSKKKRPSAPKQDNPLLGQSVRLYCPNDNTYHVGKIISHRRHARPYVASTNQKKSLSREDVVNNSQPPETFYGVGGHENLEFLVRFRSGTARRKVPVHRWIVLEEHAVAVTCAVVWGKAKDRPWWPAQIVVRSSLEILQDYLSDEADGVEVAGGEDSASGAVGSAVGSALFFGEQTKCSCNLSSQITNFLSPKFATKRATSDNLLCIAVAMAQVELEEQRRVRTWYDLKCQEGDEGIAAIAAASSAMVGRTERAGGDDRDMEDEGDSKKSRSSIAAKFSSSSGGGGRGEEEDDDDDEGKGKAKFPSVPPGSNSLVSKGVTSEVLMDMTEGRGDVVGGVRTKKRKRKKVSSVEVAKIDAETLKAVKDGRRGGKK